MKKKKEVVPAPNRSEYHEQCAVFKLAQLYGREYPELKFLNGSLNGVRLTIGQAVKAKATGMKKGMPDLFLPVKRGKCSGLFIELKRLKGGSIQPEQKLWAKFLVSQGYQHYFCKGADVAWQTIINYLKS